MPFFYIIACHAPLKSWRTQSKLGTLKQKPQARNCASCLSKDRWPGKGTCRVAMLHISAPFRCCPYFFLSCLPQNDPSFLSSRNCSRHKLHCNACIQNHIELLDLLQSLPYENSAVEIPRIATQPVEADVHLDADNQGTLPLPLTIDASTR